MWHFLDVALIVIVVMCSALYALYSLSSLHIKRVLLAWLVRCFGMRVFKVLSPRLGGCSNCEAGTRDLSFLNKAKR